MLKRDYVLTLIEDLSRFIARLAFLRETARYEQAYAEIDHYLSHAFGLRLDEALGIDLADIPSRLQRNGSVDPGSVVSMADLLKEIGDMAEHQGDEGLAIRCRERSLYLYLSVLGDGTYRHAFDHSSKIDDLLFLVEGVALPAPVLFSLMAYYEFSRRYAEAENILFDLLDIGEPGMIDVGLLFYGRLLDAPDETLEEGNLPRAEVEEGLAMLNARRDAAGGL